MQSLRSRKEKAKSNSPIAGRKSRRRKLKSKQRGNLRGVIGAVALAATSLSLLYSVVWYTQQHKPDIKLLQSSRSTPKTVPRKSLFKDTAKQVEKKDRKGNQVMKAITSIGKEDLKNLGIKLPENVDSIPYEEAIKGREKLIEILHNAGVEEIDVATALSLPKWETVARLYGEQPVVIGLETCERFRETTPLDDASMGVAGMFNTGTNPFAMYLDRNCIMPHNTHDVHGGTRWQVPWGKHTLASRKWTNTAGHDEKVNKTNVLPIAIVRDPYSWMQSMCKHPYQAKWPHTGNHCPNLVPNADDLAIEPIDTPTIHVNVRYKPDAEFDSLAHYWTAWYQEYLSADYPRLIVRFEDLQFHAKEMVDIVCQCAGAVAKNENQEFSYVVDNAKFGPGHKKSKTNLISAMIKYGTDKDRFRGMTKEDLEVASQALDPNLMQLFHYEIPSI